MNKSINKLIKEFERIKKRGYITSVKKGKGSVGITFEHALGKASESSSEPDYMGIEIKTKLDKFAYDNWISLFNLSPNSYENAIKDIQEKYGYPDKQLQQYNVFGLEVFCNKYNFRSGKKYAFKIRVDRKRQKVFFQVFNNNFELIDETISWSFDYLEQRLRKKLSYLAIVNATKIYRSYTEYFKYTDITIYKLKNFEIFLKLLETEKIKISFKICVHKTKDRYGELYNHGTAFRINKKSINELFEKIY